MAGDASFGRRNQQAPTRYGSDDGKSAKSRYKSDDRKPAPARPEDDLVPEFEAPRREASNGLAWPYIKACIMGFATAIAAGILFSGAGGGLGQFKFMQYFAGAVASMTLAPMMLLPARVLGRATAALGVRRGYADVLVGGTLGSLWLVMAISRGDPINGMHFGFIVGGMAAGLTFWRAQGYPGLSSGTAGVLDVADRQAT